MLRHCEQDGVKWTECNKIPHGSTELPSTAGVMAASQGTMRLLELDVGCTARYGQNGEYNCRHNGASH
jgi:hypothetical protein